MVHSPSLNADKMKYVAFIAVELDDIVFRLERFEANDALI